MQQTLHGGSGSFVWVDETVVEIPSAITELLQRNFDASANFLSGHAWRQCRVRKIHSLGIEAQQQNPRHELSPCFGNSLGGTVRTTFAEGLRSDLSRLLRFYNRDRLHSTVGPDKRAYSHPLPYGRLIGSWAVQALSQTSAVQQPCPCGFARSPALNLRATQAIA